MNRELRRVSLVVTAMFLALFVSATNLQVLSSDSLSKDQRNVRAIYDGYQKQRRHFGRLTANRAVRSSCRRLPL